MLPVVLNAQRVLADKIVGEFVNSGTGAFRFSFKRRLSPTDDAGVCGDFDEAHPGTRKKLFNGCDFHGVPFPLYADSRNR